MTEHQLRTRHHMVLPGVYLRDDARLTPNSRARAVWLWAAGDNGCGDHGAPVLCGHSAAVLWGARWIRDDEPAECTIPGGRRLRKPKWVRVHAGRIPAEDVRRRHGMRLTSPVRTAYDIGRHCDLDRAVEILDALYQTGRMGKSELERYADRHPRRRGVRRLREAVVLSDEGGESPWETRLRLILIRAGFPRPETQLDVSGAAVRGGRVREELIGRVDIAWACWRVLVDYEGAHHNEDAQVDKDARRGNRLGGGKWSWIRVRENQLSGDRLLELLRQIRDALIAGGAPVDVLPSEAGLAEFVAAGAGVGG